MEILEQELESFIAKMNNANDFRIGLHGINSIYPFSRYEYVISALLSKGALTFEEYLELRDNYINRNLFLHVFEITAPRGFGDTWAFSHLLSIEPELKRPDRSIDPSYQGEYDLYLPYAVGNIKIEVKASRAVDRDKADEPLYIKALSANSQKRFLMNFQQLKPSCCDVFLWLAVYRDCVKYWVLKNAIVQQHPDFTPQHRNESTAGRARNYEKSDIYEGQIMITNANIDSIQGFLVESRALRQAIIEQYTA
jgi:hypothetical protein